MSLFISAQVNVLAPDGTQLILCTETDVSMTPTPGDTSSEVDNGQKMINAMTSSIAMKANKRLEELATSANALQVIQGRKLFEEGLTV